FGHAAPLSLWQVERIEKFARRVKRKHDPRDLQPDDSRDSPSEQRPRERVTREGGPHLPEPTETKRPGPLRAPVHWSRVVCEVSLAALRTEDAVSRAGEVPRVTGQVRNP